ncbi:hypothetical protein [Sphingobium algorifonticola]|nr:hypothetical protein [Sphingobium algorifonticola]
MANYSADEAKVEKGDELPFQLVHEVNVTFRPLPDETEGASRL